VENPKHFEEKHPGPISNKADLCEEDKEMCNLFGTGAQKDSPSQYLDMYIENERSQFSDFGIVN